MQTTFDHTFRADLMKSNRTEMSRMQTNALKCFSDRILWKGKRAKHFRILERSLQDRLLNLAVTKIAVTMKIASTSLPLLRLVTFWQSSARYLLKSRNGYAPASESPADG